MRINSVLAMATGITMLVSSCQKNLIEKDEAISAETSSNATVADATVETAPPVYTSVVTNVNSNVAGYWQALPSLYSQTTKKYPLIIFLHGVGELGTNLTSGTMNCCGIPRHLYTKTFPANFNVGGVNYSFIVMAPQFKVRPSPADVQAMIDYMKARYRIDPSRVYVTGLSLGGGSTWDWSAVYGQNAAAIVPVCGGTAPSTTLSQKIASKNLAIWGLYSTADKVVPAQWGYDFFKWIDQYNTAYASKTKLTVWTDVDHYNTFVRAYNPATKVDGYNIYQWMLLNTRSSTGTTTPTTPPPTSTPPPTTTTGNIAPVAKAGADQSIPKSWNYLRLNATTSYDPDGWVASVIWKQISGPSTLTYEKPQSANTLMYGMVTGVYTFRVAVTDNKGAVSYDDTVITITNN